MKDWPFQKMEQFMGIRPPQFKQLKQCFDFQSLFKLDDGAMKNRLRRDTNSEISQVLAQKIKTTEG